MKNKQSQNGRTLFRIAVIMLLCSLVVASYASALTFDNIKTYDTNTRTATIKNSILGIPTGDVAELKLTSLLNVKVPQGYQKVAEFTLIPYLDNNGGLDLIQTYDLNARGKEIERSIDYKIKVIKSVSVDDYKTICSKIYYEINKSFSDICSYEKTGSHLEKKVVWEDLDYSKLIKGEAYTIGLFTDVQRGDFVEWIPTYYGVKINEWASWTAEYTEAHGIIWSSGGSVTVNTGIGFTTNFNDTTPRRIHIIRKHPSDTSTKVYLLNADKSINKTMSWSGVEAIADIELLNNTQYYLVVNASGGSYVRYGNGAASGVTGLSVNWNCGIVGGSYDCADPINPYGIVNLTLEQYLNTNNPPTTTAISPANDSYYLTSPQNIDFVCYGSDDINFSEMDFYFNGVLNQTNSTSLNNTNYTFTINGITDGSYNWSCLGYDNETASTASETRVFTIDATAPNITTVNFTNITTYSLPYNLSWTYNASDLNIENCYYNTSDNATQIIITCNDTIGTNFSTAGSKTIQYCANDTGGLETCDTGSFSINYLQDNFNYTTPVIESNNNTVYFNVSASSITSTSANVSYNGTSYTMALNSNNGTLAQFIRNLTAPLVTANTNVNLSVSYLVDGYSNTTANYTQLIYNIPSLNITSAICPDMALNFTLRDEGNLSLLSGDFEYNFKYGTADNDTFINDYGSITSASSFYVCVNSTISPNWTLGSGQIFYTSDGYVDRRYYLFNGTILNNQTNNITLYDLLTADQTSFKLEIEDTSLNPYVDKYTALIRWYPDLNEYNVVDMGLTDETGSTVIHVKTEDVDYRIGVYEKNGTLIKLAEPIRMVCLVSPCTYTLKISPTDIDYTSFLNVDYSFTYNYTTGIWTFTFTDTSQKTTEMNLTVYKLTGTSVYPVCTTAVSAYAGALTCNTSIYTGNLRGVVTRSASPSITIAEKLISTTSTAFTSSFGLWISMLISIPIIFLFAFMTPLGAIIGGVISLIPALFFGSINIIILGGIAILGGIVMHFLKRIG